MNTDHPVCNRDMAAADANANQATSPAVQYELNHQIELNHWEETLTIAFVAAWGNGEKIAGANRLGRVLDSRFRPLVPAVR